jgi:hypothetical protein
MRALVTWLVVGALAVIALFAARDALKQDTAKPARPAVQATRLDKRPHPPPSNAPPAIPGRDELARHVRALGAEGFLYVTDPQCRRFILRLPSLRWTPGALPAGDCGDGQGSALDLRFGLTAVQVAADTIEVGLESWRYRFRGTAPAFRPGGTLTFVRDGRLYQWSVRCPAGAQIVDFRGVRNLNRCLLPVAGMPRNVQEVVWLNDRDYVAVAGPDPTAAVVAVRSGKPVKLFQSIGLRVGGLEASPSGRYVAARLDGTLALFRTDSVGALSLPSGATGSRAISWSPDDRFAAVATEKGIFVFRAGTPRRSLVLPISASALRWR